MKCCHYYPLFQNGRTTPSIKCTNTIIWFRFTMPSQLLLRAALADPYIICWHGNSLINLPRLSGKIWQLTCGYRVNSQGAELAVLPEPYWHPLTSTFWVGVVAILVADYLAGHFAKFGNWEKLLSLICRWDKYWVTISYLSHCCLFIK